MLIWPVYNSYLQQKYIKVTRIYVTDYLNDITIDHFISKRIDSFKYLRLFLDNKIIMWTDIHLKLRPIIGQNH